MSEYPIESASEVIVHLNEKKPIRVLHVDDETSLLKIAKQCLEMEGQFQVDIASSVNEAIGKMKEESYDAVVSDYQMPGKDGLSFLGELREKGNEIPFIVFTGKGREEIAIKALNLGADQYLNKNGDPETVYSELAHAIRTSVERKKAEEALTESEEKLKAILSSSPDAITVLIWTEMWLSLTKQQWHCSISVLLNHIDRQILRNASRTRNCKCSIKIVGGGICTLHHGVKSPVTPLFLKHPLKQESS